LNIPICPIGYNSGNLEFELTIKYDFLVSYVLILLKITNNKLIVVLYNKKVYQMQIIISCENRVISQISQISRIFFIEGFVIKFPDFRFLISHNKNYLDTTF